MLYCLLSDFKTNLSYVCLMFDSLDHFYDFFVNFKGPISVTNESSYTAQSGSNNALISLSSNFNLTEV